jgi:hypothetical protein
MKAIKMLSVGLVVGVLGTGLVWGSSAMAETTALCKEDVEVCPEESIIEHIHGVSIGKAKLLSALPTIECNILSLGDVEGSGLGSPIAFTGKNTYTNCTNFCTITQLTEFGFIEALRIEPETVQLTGESELLVKCPFIHCVYNGEGVEGRGRGALISPQKNGDVTSVEQELHKVGGTLCPEAAYVDVSITALEAIYISS